MPGWKIHLKACEMLGFSTDVCHTIDHVVDEGQPEIKEVIKDMNSSKRLPMRFCFKH